MKQWKSPDFSELNIQDTAWLDDFFEDLFDHDWECHFDKDAIGNVCNKIEHMLGGYTHHHSNPTDYMS